MSCQTGHASDTFLTAMREPCAATHDIEARWHRVTGHLEPLLSDAEFKRHGAQGPIRPPLRRSPTDDPGQLAHPAERAAQ